MEELDEIIKQINDEFGEGTITTADKIDPPENPYRDFMDRNPMAGGGMLVQPSADGRRPGYAMTDREKQILRTKREKLPGAYITPLRRKFDGQKFISVKDPTYSEGRKRVKTPEYEAFLKKERAKKKPVTFGKTTLREVEDGVLLQIAEAMQKADIENDTEYLMRNKAATKLLEKQQAAARKKAGQKVYKQRVYEKGMLDQNALKLLENLETNPVHIKIIADTLGEDPDWVLNKLDEREQFVYDVRAERVTAKKDPNYAKPRNDYLKVENWLQKNAKKYANPDTFERALIRRFGKNNQFIKDMKSSKEFATVYFSDDFKKTMLNAEVRTTIKPHHLKQLIKSSLYNFNPKIKNAVTAEIKSIFNAENLPKLRTEARKLLNNNKLLSTFDLNKQITGPYAKVIQAEIGQQMWSDITNFRTPRVGTQEMLKAFEQLVAEEFKPMFNEAAKSIGYSKNNQWKKAKEVLGIADNIAWDHKIPSSLIDKGYADIIEYTKVNPTTQDFNARIKNAQFDRPLNQLITKFEKATTLDAKAKIKNQMDILKDDFSKKFGGYLDEISINLDSQGNLKFSSSANPLKMTDDTVAMLGKSMTQAGEINKNQLETLLASFGDGNCPVTFGKKKRDGGRIGYQVGTIDKKRCIESGVKNFQDGKFKTADQVQDAAKLLSGGRRVLSGLMKYGIIPELAYVGLEATGRSILGEKPLNAIKKSIDTFTFGLTDFTSGIEAEKFGKFGDLKLDVDKYRNSLAKVNSIQQDIANLEALNTGSDFGYEGDQTEAIQIKKTQLEAAKKELQQNMISPDKVSVIDRMADNIADAQMAKSDFAKASLKDQMEGIPGVADYMDTETARVFPRQPSQTELNLNLLPNFREALKTDQAKIDRTIMNAPDDVLKDISPEALELKKGLQEAYKMENLKDTFGAEQIYGTKGVFSQPLQKGGRAGFKSGALRKGIQALIDKSVKSTPKDTTSALDKLIKQTLDEDLFDKKDRIIDSINISEAKKRKNLPYNMRVFEEPKNLDFYDAIIKSNFRTKTGPYFDRIRKNKAGGGLLKQAGDRSGPPPESGPNPQGLQGLLNRVKKI